MNFKKWLYSEGKAMDVSSDMKQFASEAINKLESSKNWNFHEVIHSRVVKSKYGEKNIRVETKPQIRAGVVGEANTTMNLIYLYLPSVKNPDYIPTSFEEDPDGLPKIKFRGTVGVSSVLPDHDNIDYNNVYYTLLHEMIHLFDVKLSKKFDWMKNVETSPRDQDSWQSYYIAPHEQDAWMAHRAREVIDHYLSEYKGNKKEVKEIIKYLSHDTEPEKTWYSYPKIWRRYLNTLNHILDSI